MRTFRISWCENGNLSRKRMDFPSCWCHVFDRNFLKKITIFLIISFFWKAMVAQSRLEVYYAGKIPRTKEIHAILSGRVSKISLFGLAPPLGLAGTRPATTEVRLSRSKLGSAHVKKPSIDSRVLHLWVAKLAWWSGMARGYACYQRFGRFFNLCKNRRLCHKVNILKFCLFWSQFWNSCRVRDRHSVQYWRF